MGTHGLLRVIILGILFFGVSHAGTWTAIAADALSPRQETPDSASADPFADLIKEQPVQVIKTGPSCEFVKVQLPPGVTLDDIPGFAAP